MVVMGTLMLSSVRMSTKRVIFTFSGTTLTPGIFLILTIWRTVSSKLVMFTYSVCTSLMLSSLLLEAKMVTFSGVSCTWER